MRHRLPNCFQHVHCPEAVDRKGFRSICVTPGHGTYARQVNKRIRTRIGNAVAYGWTIGNIQGVRTLRARTRDRLVAERLEVVAEVATHEAARASDEDP